MQPGMITDPVLTPVHATLNRCMQPYQKIIYVPSLMRPAFWPWELAIEHGVDEKIVLESTVVVNAVYRDLRS